MTAKRPRSYRMIAIAVVVAALITGSGIDLAISRIDTSTSSVFCAFGAEGFLSVEVLNGSSSGGPIVSLPVHVEALYPACASNPPAREDLGTTDTNASGFLNLAGPYNWYYLTLNYDSRSYSVNASLNASTVTCATLDVPSGQMTVIPDCDPTTYFAQSTSVTSTQVRDSISVGPLSICPSDCVYPSPYVSGQVLVNATTPLLTLTVYVNRTFDGTPINNTAGGALTDTFFAYEYKGSMPSAFIPVVPGDTYVFTFVAGFQDGSSASGTSYVTVGASTSTNLGGGTNVLVQQGTTYQVQASYDCVAGHTSVPFNVTTASTLFGAVAAGSPGVTLYLATAQQAQTVSMGHPTSWVYTSEVTSSTSFNIPLGAGSYVLWTEGADLNCGATIVTPLEQLVNVTVTQAIGLTPV